MRAPVAAMGWPSEMPEPLTFRLSSWGSFHSRSTASTWAAKASLSSMRSMSSRERPTLPITLFTAGTGPMPMVAGWQPVTAQPRRKAIGVRPSSSSLSSPTTRHTDAASFWLLAFPAETEPSRITGRRRASVSMLVSARGPSSFSKGTGSPRRCGTGTPTISLSNLPSVWAATARW